MYDFAKVIQTKFASIRNRGARSNLVLHSML